MKYRLDLKKNKTLDTSHEPTTHGAATVKCLYPPTPSGE